MTFKNIDKETAEKIGYFLLAVISLREKSHKEPDNAPLKIPAVLGALAKGIVGDNNNSASDDEHFLDIPKPQIDKPSLISTRRIWQFGSILAGAAVGLLVLPPLALYQRDNRTFEEAKHNPSGLRKYLTTNVLTRHRSEAKKLIQQYYDAAIKRVNTLAEQDNADKNLYDGLLALLENLKKAESPIVPVAFKATRNLVPDTNEKKRRELSAHEAYVKEFPTIRKMAVESKDGSAIMNLARVS